jgi:hypothetical protein
MFIKPFVVFSAVAVIKEEAIDSLAGIERVSVDFVVVASGTAAAFATHQQKPATPSSFSMLQRSD